MPDPQQPHAQQASRLLRSWDFPGKSTGVGCHCFLCNEDLVLAKGKKKKKILPEKSVRSQGKQDMKKDENRLGLISASHGEGSYSLFSQGTWDISCASNMSQPKATELGFHTPTSASLSSFN